MRQAADILSSAPAMQIRYLEAMQAMAKTANSKVIFLPAANQTMGSVFPQDPMAIEELGEGTHAKHGPDFGGQDPGFERAMTARIIENI